MKIVAMSQSSSISGGKTMEISEAKHALAACMQKINQFRGSL